MKQTFVNGLHDQPRSAPRISTVSSTDAASLAQAGAPARRTTLDLLRLLREQIVSAELAPGSVLSESRVGAQNGLSRTPVREVFRRLVDEGLLRVVPQVGTFVAPIDLAAVRHSHFLRDALECRLVELAAARIDTAGRNALKLTLSAQQQALGEQDVNAFFRADETMHREIAAIAGQPLAWQAILTAKTPLDRVRRLSLADPRWARQRLTEHRRIVTAICAHRPRDAVAAMRSHLESVFAAVEQIGRTHSAAFIDTGSHP